MSELECSDVVGQEGHGAFELPPLCVRAELHAPCGEQLGIGQRPFDRGREIGLAVDQPVDRLVALAERVDQLAVRGRRIGRPQRVLELGPGALGVEDETDRAQRPYWNMTALRGATLYPAEDPAAAVSTAEAGDIEMSANNPIRMREEI